MTSPMTTHQAIAAKGMLPAADRNASIHRAKAIQIEQARQRAEKVELLALEGAGVFEISERLGIHKATVFAIAQRHKFKVPGTFAARPYTPKEKTMATTAPAAAPSAGAMRAQAQMFRLLDEHFNPDQGRYDDGWTDERVAKECSLAPAMVREFRKAGFGELKANPEIEAVRRDLAALQKLVSDETAALEARLRKLEMAK